MRGSNKYVILVLLFQSIISGTLNQNGFEGKIVGGKPVPIEQYPSAVVVFNLGALCAGTILNSWSVLTAAHCFDFNDDVVEISVHVGARHTYDHNAKLYRVNKVVRHEEYNKAMLFSCDIALIFVLKRIKFGPKAKKAMIVNTDQWMKPEEKNFVVTGWGLTSYDGTLSKEGLMMTELRFIPLKTCGQLHNMVLRPDMFCMYGESERDACKGDSGGGVLWNGMVVGIVSHGEGCAKKDKPSVYANVWYFRNWIKDTILKFFDDYCISTSKRRKCTYKKRMQR